VKGTAIGTIVSAVGYLLAIYGGWVLFRNATPDHAYGTIPVHNGADEMQEFQARQRTEMDARARANPRGFLLLTIGACLQLVGTIISGFVR
jgi:hypothetical protein